MFNLFSFRNIFLKMNRLVVSRFSILSPCLNNISNSMSQLSLSSSSFNQQLLPVNTLSAAAVSSVRTMSYFKTGGADELWKTMAGVSQQGKKRGRAKNTMKKKDLNRGQKMGFGKAQISWPGLTTKVSEGTGADTKAKEIESIDDNKYSVN